MFEVFISFTWVLFALILFLGKQEVFHYLLNAYQKLQRPIYSVSLDRKLLHYLNDLKNIEKQAKMGKPRHVH